MPRSFLKIYFDFDEKTDELSDAEKGRLLLAMYRYALTGEKPTLTGNERFLFSTFKGEIDRDIAVYNTKVTNGNMGGRKPNETEPNREEPKETEKNLNAQETRHKKQDIRNMVSKETNMCAQAFEVFWSSYPRHTNKQAAFKAFAKLNPDEVLMQTMLAAIDRQKQSDQWTKDGGQYIPHPATWLNGRRWEDEMPKAVQYTKTVAAQRYQQRDYTEDELLAVGDDLIAEARARRQA